MMKPKFQIDISQQTSPSLECLVTLTALSSEGCHHVARGLRSPLGIYNESIGRVCDKLTRLCHRLELYFKATGTLDPDAANDEIMQEVLDYLELSLYSSAEHVDDLDSIASGFFPNTALRDRNAHYRTFSKAIKTHKRFIAAAANFLKHQQARLRLFSMEFSHAGRAGILHGYFIEGVSNGVIEPNENFHRQHEVFSITTFVWEVITFLLACARELDCYLQKVGRPLHGAFRIEPDPLARAAIAAARLPLYTFGEEHPFQKCTIVLYSTQVPIALVDSGIYGSLSEKWSRSMEASFGRFTSRFAGDGQTRSFRFAQPKSVALQHWE
jgi:hypothetical protein